MQDARYDQIMLAAKAATDKLRDSCKFLYVVANNQDQLQRVGAVIETYLLIRAVLCSQSYSPRGRAGMSRVGSEHGTC